MAKTKGIKIKEDKTSASPSGKYWFFGIGINEYLEFPNLNNAVKDVEDIKALLLEKYTFDEEHVITLFNEKATEENIIEELDEIVSKINPEDRLLIYYSGHGHLNKNTKLGYWIPHDAKKDKTSRYMGNSTVRDYIKVINSKHTLLISDSCFSGSLFTRGGSRSTRAINELEKIKSRWAICSGRHDEEVLDGEPGFNSPFAESIIDSLRNNEEAGLNVARLSNRIIEQTSANYEQLPEGNPLYAVGHKGGQFIFRLKANEKEAWASCQKKNTLAAYSAFINNFPGGKHSEKAVQLRDMLQEEKDWKDALEENTILGFYNFDKKHPNGPHSSQALESMAILEEEQSWQNAIRKNKISSYKKYLSEYRNGKYKAEANTRIDDIIKIKQDTKVVEELPPPLVFDKKPPVTKPSPGESKPEIKKPTSESYSKPANISSTGNSNKKLYMIAAGAVIALIAIIGIWQMGGKPDNTGKTDRVITEAVPVDKESSITFPDKNPGGQVIYPKFSPAKWRNKYFNGWKSGTYGVIVKSLGSDAKQAENKYREMLSNHPNFYFHLADTRREGPKRAQRYVIYFGTGLSPAEANYVIRVAKDFEIAKDAFPVLIP